MGRILIWLSPHRIARTGSFRIGKCKAASGTRCFEDVVICLVVFKLSPVKSMAWALGGKSPLCSPWAWQQNRVHQEPQEVARCPQVPGLRA
jgi:hypothetical protein